MRVENQNGLGVIVTKERRHLTNVEYSVVSEIVRENGDKSVFWCPLKAERRIWDVFAEQVLKDPDLAKPIKALCLIPYDQLEHLPQRIYGHLQDGIYLSYQADLWQKPDCYYHLFSHGDLVWKVHFDPQSRSIRTESGSLPGHFISPAKQFGLDGFSSSESQG